MSAPFPQITPEQARASLLANTQTGSLFDLPNVGRYLRDVKNAGRWALPYLGAATASAPAYAIGAAKYGVPEIRKGYRQDGIVGALGGLNEAARKVPVIGDASVDLMDAATQYAEEQGAPAPAMFLADLLAPDPTGKIGALASGAAALTKGLGGLNLAVIPAFVGSPQRWSMNPELGRLTTRLDKAFTGEGAQVEGIGNYSAEIEDTAVKYRDQRGRTDEIRVGGEVVDVANRSGLTDRQIALRGLMNEIERADYDVDAGADVYLRRFDKDIEFAETSSSFDGRESERARIIERLKAQKQHTMDALDDGVEIERGNAIYGVLHDVDEEDLLDLDLPLSQQPPAVLEKVLKAFPQYADDAPRGRVGQLGADHYNANYYRAVDVNGQVVGDYPTRAEAEEALARTAPTLDQLTGRDLVKDTLGRPSRVGMEKLRDAGIPGSRYLDQLSRGKKGIDGSHNYVMFSDDLTYVDPSRTDPALIGDMPVGAPYRTVEPGTPVTVRGYKGMYPYTGGRSYNAAGEVVDETPASLIDEFDSPGRPWAGFFSPDPKVANRFSGVTEDGRVPGFEGGAVTPADIRFENPKVIDAQGDFAASVQFDPGTARYSDEFLSHFDDHDGVIITNTRDEGDIFIPRDNAQIETMAGAPQAAPSTSSLRVDAAVVRASHPRTGEVVHVEGPTHAVAIANAQDQGLLISDKFLDIDADAGGLFRLSDGTIANRGEVEYLVGHRTAEKAVGLTGEDEWVDAVTGEPTSAPAPGSLSAYDEATRIPVISTTQSGTGTLEGALGPHKSQLAVEYDEGIIGAYNDAHGTDYEARSVFDLDPEEVKGSDLFHSSPVCKNLSCAKRGRAINEDDQKMADKVVEVVQVARPPAVTVENVPGYEKTVLFDEIMDALDAEGYSVDAQVVDAADYGGAQHRSRLLIRASRDGEVPPLPEPTGPSDWFETIEDLIDDAPDMPFRGRSKADEGWEIKRLRQDIADGRLDPEKPIITMGGSADSKHAYAANAGGPSPTITSTAGSVPRIVMPDGRVKRVTGRMIARLMGLPDDFKIPENWGQAKKVLGNGIHGEITRQMIAPMAEIGRRSNKGNN